MIRIARQGAWLLSAFILVLPACDQPAEHSDATFRGEGAQSAPAAAPTAAGGIVTSMPADEGKTAAVFSPAQIQDSASAMIIRTGTASIEVDSLDAAVTAVRALAARVGGFVANVSMETGRERVRTATLELKVPATRFDEAVHGLDPLGEVESVQIGAQDVGEEYVDVTARVANARRLEERLIRLLDTRTGKLEDVLAVERELARVREEIDRMEGRLRYLRSRVALSTLTVMVHEPAPLLSDPGENIILQAFVRAWRNFVQFLAGLIAALGYLVPLAFIISAIAWLVRRLLRRLRRFRPPSSGAQPIES